jgi:hypothetical protein
MGHDNVALWGKLSNEWLHTKGYVKKILDETLNKSDIPAYALAIPIIYTEVDIDIIKELQSSVSKFRKLLNEATYKWRNELQI